MIKLKEKFSPDYFQYGGYAILGYFLKDIKITKKQRIMVTAIYFVNSISFAYCNYRLSCTNDKPLQDFYSYMKIPQFINAVCVFLFIISLDLSTCSEKTKSILKRLSEDSFGVYLVHILVLFYVINYVHSLISEHAIYSVPLQCLLICIISFIVVEIIRLVPLVRKLVE